EFGEARQCFERVAKAVGARLGAAEVAQGSPSMRRTLMTRALERVGPRGPVAAARPLTTDPEDRVLAMLRLDPRLVRLNDTLAGLRREASLSSYAVTAWRELLLRVAQPEGQVAIAKDAPAGPARGPAGLASDPRPLAED